MSVCPLKRANRVVLNPWIKIRHFLALVVPEPKPRDPRHHTGWQVGGWDCLRVRGSPGGSVRVQFPLYTAPVSDYMDAIKIRRSPKYGFSGVYHGLDLGVYDPYRLWKGFGSNLWDRFRDFLILLRKKVFWDNKNPL